MGNMNGYTQEPQEPPEPPDATMYATAPQGAVPQGGYPPHPLFPRDDDGPEERDIQFVTFRRRRSDGRIDNCPEDIPAGEINSWADVVGPWGGGEYKAIGKNKFHRIVAYFPPQNGEWMLFDSESKPFTLRNGARYRNSPPVAAPAPAAPVVAAPAPVPAPVPPAAQHPLEQAVTELVRELRDIRTASRTPPTDPVVGELLREMRAQRTSSNENAMVEMMKVMTTALLQRQAEPRQTTEPTAVALQFIKAMREWAPQPQAQPSVTERLGEYRAIRELTTPAAPAPPPSEFGEIKDLLMSVVQADAMSKTREAAAPPPVLVRRPPPPPPPPRGPLRHLPGVGMVEVVQPEAPAPRAQHEVNIDAILSDPVQRARVLKALGGASAAQPPPESPSTVATPAAPEDPSTVAAPSPESPPTVTAPADAPQAVPAPTAPHELAPISEATSAAEHASIAVPAPMAEEPAATEEERRRAEHSLGTIAGLPPAERRAALSKLPGLGANVDDIVSGMADVPAVAWPFIVAKLPAHTVRALATGPGS